MIMKVEYHQPTGLWLVMDEKNCILCAFTLEKYAEMFAKYGQISVYDMQ